MDEGGCRPNRRTPLQVPARVLDPRIGESSHYRDRHSIMRHHPSYRLALAFACLAVASCRSSEPAGAHLPLFHDVSDAPPAIQTAARAVVRIATTNAFATGSFISATGLL